LAAIKFLTSRDDKLKIRRQSETYNRSFAEWRKSHRQTLGYYPGDTESGTFTFTNSVFINAEASSNRRTELAAYKKTLSFIGKLILFIGVFIALFHVGIPYIIEYVNDNIVYDYHKGELYGPDGKLFSIIIAGSCAVFCYSVILISGTLLLKIPAAVVFPIVPVVKKMFPVGIAVALSLAAVGIFLRRIFGIAEFAFIINPERTGEFPLETVIQLGIYIIIIPILSELAFRGVLLSLLRQFGDESAVILTAVLSAVTSCTLLSANITGVVDEPFPASMVLIFPMAFLQHLVFGYFAFTSGSVATPICMSIFIATASGAHILLSDLQNEAGVVIVAFICFAAGFFAILSLMTEHTDDIELISARGSLKTSAVFLSIVSPEFLLPLFLLILTAFIPN
jgi:hypothetical protein